MLKINFLSWGFAIVTTGTVSVIDGEAHLTMCEGDSANKTMQKHGFVQYAPGMYNLRAISMLTIEVDN